MVTAASLTYSLVNRSPKSNFAIVAPASPSPDDWFLDVGCPPGVALEHAEATGARCGSARQKSDQGSHDGIRDVSLELGVGEEDDVGGTPHVAGLQEHRRDVGEVQPTEIVAL